jgi:hypothetical protein
MRAWDMVTRGDEELEGYGEVMRRGLTPVCDLDAGDFGIWDFVVHYTRYHPVLEHHHGRYRDRKHRLQHHFALRRTEGTTSTDNGLHLRIFVYRELSPILPGSNVNPLQLVLLRCRGPGAKFR